MYIRLFESGPGYDSIELNLRSLPNPEIVDRTGAPIYRSDPEMDALCKAISVLFRYTDIEEIGIGRERDVRKENKVEK